MNHALFDGCRFTSTISRVLAKMHERYWPVTIKLVGKWTSAIRSSQLTAGDVIQLLRFFFTIELVSPPPAHNPLPLIRYLLWLQVNWHQLTAPSCRFDQPPTFYQLDKNIRNLQDSTILLFSIIFSGIVSNFHLYILPGLYLIEWYKTSQPVNDNHNKVVHHYT